MKLMFQHTAARRRLVYLGIGIFGVKGVSTHSRPKAAGLQELQSLFLSVWFQHTAARRRLDLTGGVEIQTTVFQHTAARRRLAACLMVG